ncbi:MAG: aryl-sulfate sulfotransferase [Alphaproteobacteria bacterium]|nr:aryl-sulfate sulfotransferase [Alphaproteobacteria bacterium]MCB9796796.1 aryl-sulfate sulfotransferase [Alphaproteobacteria bacterium]
MLLSLLSLLACSPSMSEAEWQVSPHVDMAGALVWTSGEEARAAVRVSGTADHSWETPFTEAGTEHRVNVLGMRGGQTYSLTPLLELEDGTIEEGLPVEVTQALPPALIPAGTVIGDWPEGFFATHLVTTSDSAAVIYDSSGMPVWSWQADRGTETRIISAGLTPDGQALAVSDIHDHIDDLQGFLETVSLDGTELIEFPGENLHHHPILTPEGTWGAFEKVRIEVEEWGTVLYDRLVEIDPESGEVRVLFDPLDTYEPGPMCSHWELVLPSVDGEPQDPLYDWTHANSLVLTPDGQSWLVMFRHWDNVIKIDRATGTEDWYLGGPYDTLGLDSRSPDAFSHAHFSEATEDHLLIFDNHLHRDDGHSRVVRYSMDPDAEATPVALDFELWDEQHGTLEWLGDAITLPDDTMLISWTDQGRVSWHEPDGTLKGEMLLPLGAATGRISYLPALP